jgi:hypothetical protein
MFKVCFLPLHQPVKLDSASQCDFIFDSASLCDLILKTNLSV